MAKTTSKPRKLAHFPKAEPPESPENGTETAVMEPEAEPATPFDEQAPPADPAPPKRGRPPQGAKAMSFFERLQTITRKEWEGDRAKIKLYRLAPLINRLMSSEHKFVSVYNEPVTEERIKVDHGSGKYRLYLNYTKPGETSVELDRIELDILDQNFPPKIPPGEWMDDNRNRQWAWAKPAGAPGFNSNGQSAAPAAAPVDPLAAFNTFIDIQDRMEERRKPAEQPALAATAPAPVDPWAAAEKILNMRADNPMMAILQEQMKINAAALDAERTRNFQAQEAAREREHKLQMQLLEQKLTGQGKPFFEQLMEMASDDKTDKIKKVLGLFGGGGDGPVRAARTTPLELAREFISSPMAANIGQGVGVLLAQMMAPKTNGGPPAAYPTVLNAQNPNGTAPPVEMSEQRIQRIGAQITRPMIAHFMRGGEGADFAQSMFDMGPEDYVFMRGLGAEDILRRYRAFPEAWNYVQAEAGRFEAYIQAFCTWDPNDDEGPAPSEGDDGVVDLEQESGS